METDVLPQLFYFLYSQHLKYQSNAVYPNKGDVNFRDMTCGSFVLVYLTARVQTERLHVQYVRN